MDDYRSIDVLTSPRNNRPLTLNIDDDEATPMSKAGAEQNEDLKMKISQMK